MLGAFIPLKVVPERSAAMVLTAKAIWPEYMSGESFRHIVIAPTVTLVERLQFAQRASFFSKHARQINEIKTLAANLLSARH